MGLAPLVELTKHRHHSYSDDFQELQPLQWMTGGFLFVQIF